MARILDHNGNPIDLGLIKAEVATATPYGVRKATSQVSLTGLDPQRLAGILRAAETNDARAYLELAEEMEEKYLHYAAQLATRKRAVVGLAWSVEPGSNRLRDRKIAEFVGQQLPAIKRATFDLLDAIGKGFSVGEIMWDTSGPEWGIARIEHRDPRWFVHDKVDGTTVRLRSDVHMEGEALAPGKFIVLNMAAKSGLPIRGGLARAASWAFLFHNFSLRDWATFCEMFGIPLRLGRYDVGATPADLDILFQAVRDIGTDAAAMVPKGMEIEFPTVPAGRVGADLWEKLLDYMDRQVSKLVLGQTLTADTGQGGGGSYALGNVHNDVRTDILRADATALAEALNEQLVKLLVDLNFAGVTDYPQLSLPVEEPEDLVALAGIVEKAAGMGQPVGQAWFAKKFSIPLPADGEAVLGKPAAPAAVPPTAQRSAHARTGGEDADASHDAADLLTPALAEQADAQVARWIAEIEGMLANAESLEQFREQLLARYDNLPANDLVDVMALALAAIELRGRAEVLADSARGA